VNATGSDSGAQRAPCMMMAALDSICTAVPYAGNAQAYWACAGHVDHHVDWPAMSMPRDRTMCETTLQSKAHTQCSKLG
jgi:hypothetical protein